MSEIYTQFDTANGVAQTIYAVANASRITANGASPDIYANDLLILANSPSISFNNTATINVLAVANGSNQVEISFTANVIGSGSYGASVYANGTIVVANANINFNNTATINVIASANGSNASNLGFSVNASAISGAAAGSVNVWTNAASIVTNLSNLTYNNTATTNA